MEKIRVKIVSVIKMTSVGKLYGPYCVVDCGEEQYRSKTGYDDLIKYIGKWVICEKFFNNCMSRHCHRYLWSITNVSCGTGMDHFLFRRNL